MSEIRVPYKVVDGIEIPTDVHIPPSTPHSLAPVIIMIHGGGFMLGSSKMNNRDQIQDCLERGWIVLSVEHRLCPGVDLLEGPITDIRDVLRWAQSSGLAEALERASVNLKPDPDRVMAMGTSAGGHLALSLAYGVSKPPLAILDFYGAKGFRDPFWSQPLEPLKAKFPPMPPKATFEHLFSEKTIYSGGVSLEGQQSHNNRSTQPQGPDFNDPRQAFTLHSIANGTSMPNIWPFYPDRLEEIDPMLNVKSWWPPTCFVHGTADIMIPLRFSRHMETQLKNAGVETEFIEVEGEPHTFVGKMDKGSRTWNTQRKGFDFLEKVLRRSYE